MSHQPQREDPDIVPLTGPYPLPPAVAALPFREMLGGDVQIANKDFAVLMKTDSQGLRRWRSRNSKYQIPEPIREGNVSYFWRRDVTRCYLIMYGGNPTAELVPAGEPASGMSGLGVGELITAIAKLSQTVASLTRQNETLTRQLEEARQEITFLRPSFV